MHNKRAGFTIVELLIVIVVIGILAAITIVAFNGIQQRGRNTQTISAVKDYTKIYAAYALDHNAYPGTSNHCLGTGYTDNLCWDNRTYVPNPAVNTALQAYVSNLPNPNTTRVYRNATDGTRAGILYVNNYSFRYQLEGVGTDCGIPGAVRTFSVGQSNGPECTITLPDPTIQ
jgi:prepilin-type N-terminal cleavage/methylation domain-containing protein